MSLFRRNAYAERRNQRLRGAIAVMLALALMLPFAATADADPEGPFSIVPVCGDQGDGTVERSCDEFELLPDLQVYEVPAGLDTLVVDFVYDGAAFPNALHLIEVDAIDGSIDGIAPGGRAWREAAKERRSRVFAPGSSSDAADRAMAVPESRLIVFAINTGFGWFFSLEAANRDDVDHMLAYQPTGAAPLLMQIAFEDIEGGGDGDFDDAVYNISAPVPDLPVCGDAGDGTELLGCGEFEPIPDLPVYQAPAGVDTLIVDYVYKSAALPNSLHAIEVDDLDGRIDGVHPGDSSWRALARTRRVRVYEPGSTPADSDRTIEVPDSGLIAFALNTGSSWFFSTSGANQDGLDHSVAYGSVAGAEGTVQIAFEDLVGGGDRDFNDAVYNIVVPTCNGLPATIVATGSSVYGTNGDDVIVGRDIGAETLRIYGRGGDDVICGGSGTDRIRGGSGSDIIFGLEGDDLIRAGNGADEAYGGSGDDKLLGNDGDDRLFGDEGDDLLNGGAGTDFLDGGSGSNTLIP